MWQTFIRPSTLEQALALLAEHAGDARLVAGGTDLLVELRRGVRPTTTLIDISAIPGLRYVELDREQIRLGALATHNDILAAPFVRRMLPLAQAAREVGAPQIRARGTIAGNLVTASPANDTIAALIALDAELTLASAVGERVVPLREFYLGVRRTVLKPDEVVREIRFAALSEGWHGLFLKLGLRRAQAISVVNLAIVLHQQGGQVAEARIALGCVAPTVIRAAAAEQFLVGRALDPEACAEAARLAAGAATPIDDLRGSAEYRRTTTAALVEDGLRRIVAGQAEANWEAAPVLLEIETTDDPAESATQAPLVFDTQVHELLSLTINGQPYTLAQAHTKTLLDALREDAGLTGSKEGCGEGECGACTVWVDGRAVMACLTPAAQAHGRQVTTIEGLAAPEELHPLQQAFIAHGAVQCGFCTPGFLMAAAKLLQEHPEPTQEQIQTAISGNLCRCTGYKQIIEAIRSVEQRTKIKDQNTR